MPSFTVIQNVALNAFSYVSDVNINWNSSPTIWSGSYHDHPLVKHEWIWIYGNIKPLSYVTCYPSWSGLSHRLDIFANYLLLVTSNVNPTYLITLRINTYFLENPGSRKNMCIMYSKTALFLLRQWFLSLIYDTVLIYYYTWKWLNIFTTNIKKSVCLF